MSSANITVVYYSATGNVAAMAHALAEGASGAGATVRVRRVPETAPADAVAANPKWAAFAESNADEIATLADLEWADGIALGSPTRFGNSTSQLRSFLDTTGGLWFKNALSTKVGTSFTAASTLHGGLESTILAMNNVFYHWGSIIMPLGYGEQHVARVTGNPYGASWVSRGGAAPDEDTLESARLQGKRLAEVSAALAPR